MNKKKFTLIEMLVVIAIIGILASMIMPALQNSIGQARQVQCATNLKNIGLAHMQYTDNHNGKFAYYSMNFSTSTTVWVSMIKQYAGVDGRTSYEQALSDSALLCPENDTPFEIKGWDPRTMLRDFNCISYAYSTFLGGYPTQSPGWRIQQVKQPSKVLSTVDSSSWRFASYNSNPAYDLYQATGEDALISSRHNLGANGVFADGHASRYDVMPEDCIISKFR